MRLWLLSLLFTIGAAASPPVPSLNIAQRVLPNGLTVYSVENHATPTIALHVWYHVGSKDDPPGRSGFAHLFEHLMFKSTRHMKAEMMDRLTEDVGGWNNATTLDDATDYMETIPSNYLETLLWAESDRMSSLTVDEPSYKSERGVVEEEYRFRVAGPPYGLFYNALLADSFETHPYRRPGIGKIEDLEAATLEDVRAFHETFYRPDNATLVVVGDFDTKQLNAWIDEYFGPIPKPDRPIPRVSVSEPPRKSEKRVDEYGPDVPLPALGMTWLAPAASSEDAAALDVVEALLGQGESSRLQETLVRGEISQDVAVDSDLREDLGLFEIATTLGSGHEPAEAEKIIRGEFAKLATTPVTKRELQKAKNQLITATLRRRETNDGKADAIGQAAILEHDPTAVNRDLAAIDGVTAEDVMRVVKKYITGTPAVVITYREKVKQ
jgi:zinc protease